MVVFGILAVLTAAAGVLMTTNETVIQKAISLDLFDSSKPVGYTELGSDSSDPSKLKAMVKGSIYETGEQMTVYGACMNAYGQLIPGSNATFDSWFRNGTQWQNTSYMTPILNNGNPTGRWKIDVNMSSQPGTYLTQITCSYLGDTAIAFGEWQNPDWVTRISTIEDYVIAINDTTTLIYDVVNNITIQIDSQTVTILDAISNLTAVVTNQYNNLTNQITIFEGDVQSNFTDVLTQLGNITTSLEEGSFTGLARQHAAVYDLVSSIDYSFWILDTADPYYSGGSPNTYDCTATDMSSPDNVWFVTSSGDLMYKNSSEEYTSASYPAMTWSGVSALEANTNYAWAVGSNTTSCFYSINTATPVELTATSSATCEDIVAYYSPTLVASYVVATNGDILQYNGTAWTNIGSTGTTGSARLDMLQDNSVLFIAQNDTLAVVTVSNNSINTYTQSGAIFADVSAVYDDAVWLVSQESPWKVYIWDGSVFTAHFTAVGSMAIPMGIKAHNDVDVWVVTDTPGSFYRWDGKQWSFAEYPYSAFVGIVIGFNASAGIDMKDITMFSEKDGYACGDDGLILEYQDKFDNRFDSVDSILLSVISNQETLITNVSTAITLVQNLTTIVEAMNASIALEFDDLNAFLVAMNASMISRFNTIDSTLTTFQTNTNDSFNNVISLLNDLNYTVNFQFDNITAELNDIDSFLVNFNSSVIVNFNEVFNRFTLIDNNLTFIQNQIVNLDAAMAANFTYTNNLINVLGSWMATNFTYTNSLINDLDVSMAANFTYTNSLISALESAMAANFTYTNNYISSVNTTLYNAITDNYNLLVEINTSNNYILTNVTYTNLYLTSTLFPLINNTNYVVNNIYSTLLGIETTVNNINTTVGDINDTVTIIDANVDELLNRTGQLRAWIAT